MGALPSTLQKCGINDESVAGAFHGENTNQNVMVLSGSNIDRISTSSTDSSITISTVDSSKTSASSS